MGAEQPLMPVPPPPRDRWPAVRRWLLGVAALFALGSAAGATFTGEPLFSFSAWIFASLPVIYLIVSAIRGAFARAAGAGMAAGLVLVIGASTFVALTSCGNRLEAGEDLSGCDLTDVELAGLNLSRTNLSNADLSGAALAQTNFNDSNLEAANLANARFDGTAFRNANLNDADLTNTDLARALLPPSSLEGATLDGANLQGVDLGSVSLAGASARGANLANSNLSRADLSGVALDGSTLDGATLIGATGLTDDVLAQSLGVSLDGLPSALTERGIRLELRDDILAGLSGACSGSGVAGTAPYPQGDFHPMVILDERGGVGVDTQEGIRLGWEPMAVRFAQLVACVSEEEDTQVEVCPYTLEGGGNASISRVRYHRDIRVVEASTGRTVYDKMLEGSNPPECPLFHTFSNLNTFETFGGSNIAFSKVQREIARFVS
ncbi:MAG: pentapeptide repeat-containing protein [Actinomycetota bacterium]